MIRPPFAPMTVPLAVALAPLAWGVPEAAAQETQIRGFADVNFDVSDRKGENSSFGLGKYDLLVRSRLSEDFYFLAESVFEFEEDFEVDVERLQVEYVVSPHLQFAVGRQHTPIGFWNTEYHHGKLLEPTIERPLMFRFSDEGGPLPTHVTGISISGSDLGGARLAYDVTVGNGIGSTPVEDNNESKSLTTRLYSQVNPFTRLGVAWYTDHISAGTEGLGGDPVTDPVRMNMFEFFGTYLGPRIELLAEYVHIRNRASGVTGESNAFYAYGGVRMGRAVPYLMVEALDFAAGDPYYDDADDVDQVTLGFRWDAAATIVLKTEIRRVDWGRGQATEFAMQAAVGF